MRFRLRAAWWPWAIVLAFFLSACDSGGGGVGLQGQAILGPLAGATVEIHEMQDDGSFDLLFTETTTNTGALATSGLFNAHAFELDPDRLYLFKAIGGMDLDANDDGVLDPVPTPNNGALHGVFTGAQVQQGRFHVSILSELVYQRILYMLGANYPLNEILMAIDEYTRTLLAQDVNGDGEIDRDDLLSWEPVDGKGDLRRNWSDFSGAVESVRANDTEDLRKEALMLTDNALAVVPMPCGARAVYVDGNIAYVADSDCGIAVVDVTDPTRPNLLTIEPTSNATRDLVVIGSYLYVVGTERFYTYDVANPADPVRLYTDEIGDGHRLTRSGNLVFVAESENGVRVYDVSPVPGNPPLRRDLYDTPGDARDVFFANGYVYVADDEYLTVLDPANPDELELAGTFDRDDSEGIAVAGNRAYVGYRGDDGLHIVDVSDPGNMFGLGNLESKDGCEDLAVLGNYAYVTADDAGLMVANVANPSAPVLVGYAKLTDTDTRNVTVANGYAYLATNAGLAIIDLASLNAGEFVEPDEFFVLGNTPAADAEDVVASGDIAFVVSGSDGMFAIDFSNPYNPVVIDEVDTPDDADGIAIEENLIYIADESSVQVVDVTDPYNCVVKPALDTADENEDIAVRDGYAYVPDRYGNNNLEDQFLVFDVRDPDNPLEVGDLGLGRDSARGVALSPNPNYVYVAWGFSGLVVVDVSNKTDPFRAADLQVPDGNDPDWCDRVAAYGNYAYVMGDDIYVVDVTSPANPAYVRTLDGVNDIVFFGAYGYAAAGNEGVKVYDMTDPSDPQLIEVLFTVHDARGVAVSNGMLLVADEEGGFSVLKSLGTTAVP